jgi:hypothetical protein
MRRHYRSWPACPPTGVTWLITEPEGTVVLDAVVTVP